MSKRKHARTMGRRRAIVAIAVGVGVFATVGSAWAYFSSHGSGTGAAVNGNLNPPTGVVAGPASGPTVPVHWTASSTSGSVVTPQGYYVTESNGSTTSPACGTDSTHLITTGTSCTDGDGTTYGTGSGAPTNAPLANGLYTYTVTAVYHSWSASGTAGSVSVTGTPPTVTATNIGQAAGAVVNGYVQDNAGYYIYANVNDNSGNGIQSVTANVANVSSGDTAVTLTAGSFTAPGGGTFAYRSGVITSNAGQADGLVSYSVNATDNSSRTSAYSNNGSVTFDTSTPTVAAPTVASGDYSSTSVPVSLGTATDNSGGSGVNSSTIVLQRDQAVLTNNTCGTFPGTFGTTVTLAGNHDTTVTSGFCYRYREQVADNVGNLGVSLSSNVAMVDAIAPVVPLPTVNGH